MNEWQRAFLQKLETAKKQWLHRFEQFAADFLEPTFEHFSEFTGSHGFSVMTPPCEPGNRLYKFSLTENGYVLLTFRMLGLEEVEARSDIFLPGVGSLEPVTNHANLCDAGPAWLEQQFQGGLERFIIAFGEAGSSSANLGIELVTA